LFEYQNPNKEIVLVWINLQVLSCQKSYGRMDVMFIMKFLNIKPNKKTLQKLSKILDLETK
jgi:hypothetical protein